MEKEILTRASRSEVIEAIAYKAFAHMEYPSSAEYNAICQALVTKYSTLKESTGNGYVSAMRETMYMYIQSLCMVYLMVYLYFVLSL